MKSAIVVDWLDQYAGSERVLTSMSQAIPFDEYHSLICIMDDEDLKKTFGRQVTVNTTLLQLFGKRFRAFLPLFPLFVKQLSISPDIDVVISSSHSIAKSVRKPEDSLHISYFQARNMKYIWEESSLYFTGWKKLFLWGLPLLRWYDKKSAQNPDFIIANSKYVQDWVRSHYTRESTLIYPPVDTASFTMGEHQKPFFVTVGRLEPYKRFDLLIDAFNENDLELIVIGDGSQRRQLEQKANPNISFTGYLTTTEINQYLGDCRAFVYAGVEDFGIAPVEAQATGAPVICLNAAGTAETVLDGKTGVHFNEQNIAAINDAIKLFEQQYDQFDPKEIRSHALNFSEANFIEKFSTFVDEKYKALKKAQ